MKSLALCGLRMPSGEPPPPFFHRPHGSAALSPEPAASMAGPPDAVSFRQRYEKDFRAETNGQTFGRKPVNVWQLEGSTSAV
jgi:hypothetical protein